MDRAYQCLDVHAGGNPPVESDEHAPPPSQDQQDPAEVIAWILHLQREGFYFQRKNETRDVVDGYRAPVEAGTADQSLLCYIDEIWENAQEDVKDFYAADGGGEAPSQGTSRGGVFGA